MKIISKEKFGLIDRTELSIEFQHTGKATPTNNEVKKEISKELKADENLIVIKNIITKFGEGTSLVKAFVYDTLEELKKLEKYEEPKAEEKKEEEPKEEKPAEETPKVEEKPKEDDKETETKEQTNK
jgi:ribosomal protein S24E